MGADTFWFENRKTLRKIKKETRDMEMAIDKHVKDPLQRIQVSSDIKLYNLYDAVLMLSDVLRRAAIDELIPIVTQQD